MAGKEPGTSQSKTPVLENALISMSEEEVRKKLGEPTMVSLTLEDRIIWTYVPDGIEAQDSWKKPVSS